MEADFEQRLRECSKEDLIGLVRVIIHRHPLLLAEVEAILDKPNIATGRQDWRGWRGHGRG